MDTLTYRPATSEDIDEIIELNATAYGGFQSVMTPENWAAYIGGIRNRQKANELFEMAKCTVCLEAERIVGVVFFIPAGNPTALFQADWSYVRMLGVHPDYRGLGIAKKLMEFCLDDARQGRERIIALHTSEFMDAARHIYENLGFRVHRDVPGLYGKQYWIYTLELT